MEKKEEQLREAAENLARQYFSFNPNSDMIRAIITVIKSEASKQYHCYNDSVEGLNGNIISDLKQIYNRYNGSHHYKMLDAIEEYIVSRLQKQQESDAVEFAEWIFQEEYIQHYDGLYYYKHSNNGNPKTVIELYSLFKSNNNGNTN